MGSADPDNPRHWLRFVGCFAARVTLYSQQVRALNLIYELDRKGLLPGGKSETIAIVDAGAAGITAAAALAVLRPDVTVDIFEAREKILHLQQDSTSRYLRPHVYDWPAPGAVEDDAHLPILNWRAGTAAEVALQINHGFEQLIRADNDRIRLRLLEQVKELQHYPRGQFYELTIYCGGTNDFERRLYRWVLVCVGFGLERALG